MMSHEDTIISLDRREERVYSISTERITGGQDLVPLREPGQVAQRYSRRHRLIALLFSLALACSAGSAKGASVPVAFINEGPNSKQVIMKGFSTNDDYHLNFSYPSNWYPPSKRGEQIIVWKGEKPFDRRLIPLEGIANLPDKDRPKDFGMVQITLVSGLDQSLDDYVAYVMKYEKTYALDQLKSNSVRWNFTDDIFMPLSCVMPCIVPVIQPGTLFVALQWSNPHLSEASKARKTGAELNEFSPRKSIISKVAVIRAYRDADSGQRESLEGQISQILNSIVIK
jgi:hypothetical protein